MRRETPYWLNKRVLVLPTTVHPESVWDLLYQISVDLLVPAYHEMSMFYRYTSPIFTLIFHHQFSMFIEVLKIRLRIELH